MNETEQFIEEERDRRTVRAWYGNIAFFAFIAAGIVVLALIVAGSLAG